MFSILPQVESIITQFTCKYETLYPFACNHVQPDECTWPGRGQIICSLLNSFLNTFNMLFSESQWELWGAISSFLVLLLLIRGHSGRVVTLASHLWDRGSIPGTASSGKAGSCLPLVGSLQYRTLTNCMYWFPLPFQLPVVIWPVQCWKRRQTPNK